MLSILDYVVLGAMMLVFLFIGFFFRTRKDTTVDDYLISQRNMSPWPVGVSSAVTLYSGVALTVVMGEVYLYGAPVYMTMVAGICSHVFLNRAVVPHFYGTRYVSFYQYLEERFSGSLRIFSLLIFFLGGLSYVAVATYVACMSLSVIADIPFWIAAVTVGAVCTAYSATGGIKAVIWTDVIQALTMFLFSFMIFGKVCFDVGPSDIWNKGFEGQRINFPFKEGPTVRYSVPSFLCTYLVGQIGFMATNQACIQRWQCTSSPQNAQKSVTIALWLCGVFGICSYVAGVCLYVYYKGCDVITTKTVAHSDRISLHFMVNEFGSVPGLVGLALSGILNGSLSTYSSIVNSCAAVVLQDFVNPHVRKPLSNAQQIRLCKVFTVFFGAVSTGLVLVVALSKSAIMVQTTTSAATQGPMVSLLILGLFSTRSCTKGVTIGVVTSMALIIWMSVGSQMSSIQHDHLPLDVSQCPGATSNVTDWLQSTDHGNSSSFSKEYIFPLYTVSFYWFPSIGLLVALVVGYLSSYLFQYQFWKSKPKTNIPTDIYLQIIDPEHNGHRVGIEPSTQNYDKHLETSLVTS